MNLALKLAAALAALSLTACKTSLETLHAPVDATGWTVAHAQDVPGRGTIVERIPAGETLSAWTRMITIQFLEGEHRSPAEVMAALEDAMREREGTVTWTVLESDDVSVLYEWRLEDSPTHADQSELARLLRGNDGVHRIAFTRKGPAFEADLRATWLEHLRGATVVKDGERVVLAATD